MINRTHVCAASLALGVTLAAAGGTWAETISAPVVTPHVRAQLVALDRLDNGRLSLGLRLTVKPGWHTYWRNPGDSGEPPTLKLATPDGATATIVEWPAPERIDIGGIVSYGHDGEVLFVAKATLPPGTTRIAAEATWLVCDKVCVPEAGKFQLDVVAIDPPAAATVALKPVLPPSIDATLARIEDRLRLSVDVSKLGGAPVAVYFYPYQGDVIDHSAKQGFRIGDGTLALDLTPFDIKAKPPLELSGLLEVEIAAAGGREIRRFEVLARPGG
jgi:thiol:disulfide interchange protein DsbD